MLQVGTLLREATASLAGVSDTPRLDAELLLAHALKTSRTRLLAMVRDTVDAPGFNALLARRREAEPVAYILGEKEFFGLSFVVRPPTLIPRPETEHLVEVACSHLGRGGGAVLDLCTGSGCVAIAIARHCPGVQVTATDLDAAAIELATENAARHGAAIAFHQGDLLEALPAGGGPFAAVVSNPPYVETGDWPGLAADIRCHEDPAALLSGEDGLDHIRRIIQDAPPHLAPGGLLALEIGERQWGRVASLLSERGMVNVRAVCDLAGIRRIALGQRAD